MHENKLIAYCTCCGLAIYSDDTYAKIDGEYYCNYCGGEDGLTITEMKELENNPCDNCNRDYCHGCPHQYKED